MGQRAGGNRSVKSRMRYSIDCPKCGAVNKVSFGSTLTMNLAGYTCKCGWWVAKRLTKSPYSIGGELKEWGARVEAD